jgi:hypothetical protein
MMSVQSPSEQLGNDKRLSRRRSLHSIGYWCLLTVLVLEVCMSAEDYVAYLGDPTTYRQVYQNIDVYLAFNLTSGALASIAMLFQLAGWRRRQTSWVGIAYLLLRIGFAFADHFFNIIVLCCT